MTLLGAVRPDDWNLPLFLHVVSAMVLVGALVLVASSLVGARGAGGVVSLRLGYRSLLLVALPAWIVMRLAGEWTASEENLTDLDPAPAWLDMGYMISEPSFLLLIVATILAAVASRRASRAGHTSSSSLNTVAVTLVGISLIAYIVAIWAMTTKPD